MCPVSSKVLEKVSAPCCTYFNTDIVHRDLRLVSQAISIAGAQFGWKLFVTRDELDDFSWRVYLGDKGLTKEQVQQVCSKQGPVQRVREILNKLSKNS